MFVRLVSIVSSTARNKKIGQVLVYRAVFQQNAVYILRHTVIYTGVYSRIGILFFRRFRDQLGRRIETNKGALNRCGAPDFRGIKC